MKVLKTVGSVFAMVGLVFLVVALLVYVRSSSFVSKSSAAKGTVTGLLLRTDAGRTYRCHHPAVRFETTEGQTIEFVSSSGNTPPAYEVGEAVTVLYDPANPHRACIDSFTSLWLLPLIFGLLGVVFGGVGGGLLIGAARAAARADWLRHFGRRIEAEFQSVDLEHHVKINGRHPYRIVCRWQDPSSGESHVFRSDMVLFDPTPFVQGRKLTVHIDPNDPRRHVVDTSFLPESGS